MTPLAARRTLFARDDIKRTLREGGRPLSLGTGEISTVFYPPCDSRTGCDPSTAQCVPCPLERVYGGVECCVQVKRPMVSMKGEWFHVPNEPMMTDGGHSINMCALAKPPHCLGSAHHRMP
jgi:hypothetical protein